VSGLHVASSQPDGFAEASRTHTEMVVQEIAAAIGVSLRDVEPSCRLVSDLGATASDLLILRTGLELTFGVYVPSEHVRAWRTVADVQAYVHGRVAAERITG
jgi:acyl carrier protein